MEWDLIQLDISNKKVHMGINQSFANLASANKIVPSYGVVLVLGCIL